MPTLDFTQKGTLPEEKGQSIKSDLAHFIA